MPSLVSPEVLEARFREHYAYGVRFAEHWTAKGLGAPIVLNPNALFLAIKSAYDDIERYKAYHLDSEERSNSVKRAAYVCKWICKTKPLEYADAAGAEATGQVGGLLANADFSLHLGKCQIAAEAGRHFRFSDQYQFELLYDLTFRELTEDALLHIFQNAFTWASGRELYSPL